MPERQHQPPPTIGRAPLRFAVQSPSEGLSRVQPTAKSLLYDDEVQWLLNVALIVSSLGLGAAVANAQVGAPPGIGSLGLLPAGNAIERDAREIAGRLAISSTEADRQLRLQQASVAVTDAITERYASRLAGISLDHVPTFRIIVLLTGNEPVADQPIEVRGDRIEVTFVTGARASHVELVQAISAFQSSIWTCPA